MLTTLRQKLHQLLLGLLMGAVRGYRCVISPLLGPRCRYLPSCSAYCLESLARYGLQKGLWLSVKRLARCHPWGSSGYDPVP
jgi:putative membrane protein insertion efficiency factor